jgi:hypothetical protein
MSMCPDIAGPTSPMLQQWGSMHATLCRLIGSNIRCSNRNRQLVCLFFTPKHPLGDDRGSVVPISLGKGPKYLASTVALPSTKSSGRTERNQSWSFLTRLSATGSFSISHRRVLAVSLQSESNDDVKPIFG